MSEDKKARKERARAAMREQATREWGEHMVLEPSELKSLLDHLDARLGQTECDHSLRLTHAWGVENGIDSEDLERSVSHFGGNCDCEVLANVDPQTQVQGWPRYLELYGKG